MIGASGDSTTEMMGHLVDSMDVVFGTGKYTYLYHIGFFISSIAYSIISLMVILGLNAFSITYHAQTSDMLLWLYNAWFFLLPLLTLYSVVGMGYTFIRRKHVP